MIPDCQWVIDRIKEWYDKIIEMTPDIPEDIWGELIPGGKPGGPEHDMDLWNDTSFQV